MSAFPTGVVVVTAVDNRGMPHGVTLNSFCSVSPEPPLLLICVAHTSRTLSILRERRHFLVNFLARGSDAVSRTFASKRENKFDHLDWRLTKYGNPLLYKDVIAYAECELFDETDAGDHSVLLGKVLAGRAPSQTASPLLYFRREYDRWLADRKPGRAVADECLNES